MSHKVAKEERFVEEHPSIDKTHRHLVDQRLRKFGFSIYKRPKDGEPKWKRKNEDTGEIEYFTVREALIRIDEDAKYREA